MNWTELNLYNVKLLKTVRRYEDYFDLIKGKQKVRFLLLLCLQQIQFGK